VVVAECGHGIQGEMETAVIPNKPELDDAGWRQLAEGLDNVGGIARDEDMKVVYHHHMGTVVQSREDIDRLMSMTDPELVFLLADTGHITFTGGDPVSLIHDYADRIKHIHLKDIRADVLQRVKDEDLSFLQAVKEGVFTVPGDGMIDYAPIFAEIEAMDYHGWLLVEAEQDPEKANPLEYAQKAREYIREVAGI
jgi:inosose dehydratase